MVEAELKERAITFAGLAALIDERFYRGELEDDATLPAVTLRCDDAPREHANVQDPGVVYGEYSFTAWGGGGVKEQAVAEQVRKAFQDWSNEGAGGSIVLCSFQTWRDVSSHFPEARGREVVFEVIYRED